MPVCALAVRQLLTSCSIFTQCQAPASHKGTDEHEEHVYEVESSKEQEELYQNLDRDDQYQAAGNTRSSPTRALVPEHGHSSQNTRTRPGTLALVLFS